MEEIRQTTESQAPDNNLIWAILSTLLCCWPFGIPAIVNAAKVDKLWMAGKRLEAINASNDALKWAMISAGVAFAFWIIYVIIIVIAAVTA